MNIYFGQLDSLMQRGVLLHYEVGVGIFTAANGLLSQRPDIFGAVLFRSLMNINV